MLPAKSGVNTGATDLAEENTSLFDYVHDNNFCLVVSLLVLFFGMLVINIVSLIFLLNKPCYSLGEVKCLHRMFSSQGS
jgi:hypothetical protein